MNQKQTITVGVAGLVLGAIVLSLMQKPSPHITESERGADENRTLASQLVVPHAREQVVNTKQERTEGCQRKLRELNKPDLLMDNYTLAKTPKNLTKQLNHLGQQMTAISNFTGCVDLAENDPLKGAFDLVKQFCDANRFREEVTLIDGSVHKLPKQLQNAVIYQCAEHIALLQAQLFAEKYDSVPASQIKDVNLIDRLFFGVAKLNRMDWLPRYRELAERRFELRPNDKTSRDTLLRIHALGFESLNDTKEYTASGAELTERRSIQRELERLIESFSKRSPADPELLQAQVMLARSENNTEKMRELANNVLKINPDSSEAIYTLAMVDFMEGNAEGTVKKILSLINKEGGNERWGRTLTHLRMAPKDAAVEEVFISGLLQVGSRPDMTF